MLVVSDSLEGGGRIVTTSGNELEEDDHEDKRNINIVYDSETGKIVKEPLPVDLIDITETGNRLPDGRLVVIQGNIVMIVSTQVPPQELARRQWLARPDPEWHQSFATRFKDDPFAQATHRSLEQQAYGWLAIQQLDFVKAQFHFQAAQLLKPRPYNFPEVAPPPRLVKPLSK